MLYGGGIFMNFVQIFDVCGEALGGVGIPGQLARIIALIVLFIQVFVPILLIVWGMLDLGKAVMAQKEDEIKKGQNIFIKRLIAAAIVFFVVTIVKFLVGLVADSTQSQNISNCIDSILSCTTSC
jgi:hypothetical protein